MYKICISAGEWTQCTEGGSVEGEEKLEVSSIYLPCYGLMSFQDTGIFFPPPPKSNAAHKLAFSWGIIL